MYIHHDGPPSFHGGHNVTNTGKWEITVGHTIIVCQTVIHMSYSKNLIPILLLYFINIHIIIYTRVRTL